MSFQIRYYGPLNPNGLPANTCGTLPEAIETAQRDMNHNQKWADRFEIVDGSNVIVHQEARQP